MIITQTPLRISFVGGGSDLPAFYQQEVGAVVSTTINKYIYITVNPKFDDKIRVSYSRTEIVDHVDELQHELVREALRLVGIDRGIEITSISDIPSRGTGLGSSSAYTVGLLNALYVHKESQVMMPERLAREACIIEIEKCGRPIGRQDQYISAHGGLRFLQFNPDGTVYAAPIFCELGTRLALSRGLMLFYTGIQRDADPILADQSRNILLDDEKRAGVREMVELAYQLREALLRNDLGGFGEVLHAGWMRKRELADGIATPEIDEWYERARKHGAIGGKILGAGGGGFLLLYAPPERHMEIRRELSELVPVDFSFANQGSKLVYVGSN